MNYRLLFLYTLAGLLALGTTADQLPYSALHIPDISPENSNLRFIKNEGQWEEFIKYKVPIQSGNLFLENQRLSWSFEEAINNHGHKGGQAHEPPPQYQKMHAYRVHFEGANPQPPIIPSYQFPQYHNYFIGNDRSKWKGGVPLYGMLTYKELYPGTDLRMYGFGEAIKYDFIIQAGISPENIHLRYEGADVKLEQGELLIKTSLSEVREFAPVAYQVIKGQKIEVECEYVLDNDVLSFAFPNGYNSDKELIIDPTLIFSSYTGSSQDNWGFTATYDNDGNAYAGGIVLQGGSSGSSGYPTTIGAFQVTYGGGMADAAISKFSSDGSTLLYSTYLGGSLHDQPHSLVVNDAGELFVLGRTESLNFPTSLSAFSRTNNGSYDLFLTRFSADGTNLLASTYVGGSNEDGVNGSTDYGYFPNLKFNYGDDARGEIILDDLGNVYVASPTKSINFPVTNGAFQTASGGSQDGCIFKMPPELNIMTWASYIGGNRDDAAYALQVDDEYNVYVTGGTMSANFVTTANAYQPTYQSPPFLTSFDGFVAKISNDGSTLLSSTFLGTNQLDQGYLIQLDDDNDVYIFGQTTGSWPIVNPPSGPVYNNFSGKQFITKLNNELSAIIYSTVFGGSNRIAPNISPTAFLVDKCENVYASGWGGITNSNIQRNYGPFAGTTSGLPITNDAIKPNTQTGNDLYLMVLSRDAQDLLYGSFFGSDSDGTSGEHLDGGTCRFDKNGVIYHAVCASCGGGRSSFPTSPGAWSNINGYEDNCNLAVFKLAFELAGISADFVPLDTLNAPISNFRGCAPLTVNFENTSQAIFGSTTTSYFWDFDDNGNTSTQFEPTYTFRDSGTYNVMLVINDPQSCNESDTSFHIIEVFPPVSVDAGPGFNLCGTDSVTLTGAGVGVGDSLEYEWIPTTGLSDPNIPNPRAAPSTTTIYTLRVTNQNGCTGTDTLTVAVAPQLTTNLGEDTTICVTESLQLDASNINAQTYSWMPTTFLDDPTSATPTISNLDTETTYIVTLTNPSGCNTMDTITVRPFDISLTPDTAICAGESVFLSAFANDSNANFSWTPAATLDDPNSLSPLATPLTTTTYTLTATRPSGCSISRDLTISINPIPIAEAGTNDTICVGESLQLQASGGGSYQWSPNAAISDINISNPVVNPNTSTTYTLSVTDAIGCINLDSVRIEVGEIPNVVASEDQSVCRGEAVQLSASGADLYEWSGLGLTDPNIADPFAQPQSSTIYTVRGTNIWGCSAEDHVNIEVTPGPVTMIENPGKICLGETITLSASGGELYAWSTGDTAESITVTPAPNSIYSAIAIAQGCVGTPDSIEVDVSTDFPFAQFAPSSSEGFAPVPIKFFNFTSFASKFEWDFGTGATSTEREPIYTFPSAGDYEVRLVAWSASGCPDTTYWKMQIDNVVVHIPSAFTPNNDGINDEFFIGHQGLNVIRMRIFTRWGELIYESSDPNFTWDGRYKGRIVPEGVFTYTFKGLGINNILYEKSGTISIIK